MPTIRVLTDDLASQVAAGEVVERPAAAVKELVENCLDAGAKNVLVQIEGGGAHLIRVTDDGHGMDREDAFLSVQRHATSKLKTREDLDRITTLGFRGEALPSIASVSKFRLMTRPHDALSGVEIRIEGGKHREARDYGGPPGTIVEAANLFFCVPGRRKFLRAESTEAGHVEHQVRLHAIAAWEVGFTFQRNRKELFRLPAASGLRERIHDLASPALAAGLVDIPPLEHRSVRISGLVGPPAMARKDRQFCLAYLNGRPIDAKQVSFALREAFGPGVERGRSPVAFLFLEVDPSLVDVNVHPAKREVRFRDARTVQEAIIEAVQGALTSDARASLKAPWEKPTKATLFSPPESPSGRTCPTHAPSLPPSFRRPGGSFQPHLSGSKVREEPPVHEPSGTDSASRRKPPLDPAAAAIPPSSRQPDFRIFGSLKNGIAILESAEGLVLLDLRAAHERILYDEILADPAHSGPETLQPLLVPAVIDLGAKHHGLLIEHKERLGELGFGLEEFGSHTIRVTSLPGFLKNEAPEAQLLAILDDMEEGARGRGGWEAVVARRASRQAIPTETTLPADAVSDLIESLLGCEMPYCAPDGRPTLIQFSYQELDRRFGRDR